MAKIAIVGGGMSGLSLAVHLKRLKPEWELAVFESEPRPGGKAWTIREDGFKVEYGVNGILDNKPHTLELAGMVGAEILRSNDAARRRYVVKRGRLVKLPESPKEFLTSPLLSFEAKLRVVMESIIPKGNMEKDESLASFARRRLGKEAFQYLIDPMASGIYAGDPEKLSLKSCFPRIHELEKEYGSLIRAMIKLQRKAKKEGRGGPGAGPGGTLTSFKNGMEELVEACAQELGSSLRTNTKVVGIDRESGLWKIELGDGTYEEASHLVLAAQAKACAGLIKNINPDIASLLESIQYPPIAVAAFAFKTSALLRPLDGFGFLCPWVEGRKILGALWDSSVFKYRAPDGYSLIRVLAGGARRPEVAGYRKERLVDTVLKELNDIMGISARPEAIWLHVWPHAIPQYQVGYSSLLESIEKERKKMPNIFFRCNWVGGVSLNDCVANSKALAYSLSGSKAQ